MFEVTFCVFFMYVVYVGCKWSVEDERKERVMARFR